MEGDICHGRAGQKLKSERLKSELEATLAFPDPDIIAAGRSE
jgi:hypothetical protein